MNKKTVVNIAKGRSMILVDIENLVGSGQITEQQVSQVRSSFMDLVKPGPRDQYFVASSHHNQLATSFGWPEGQHQYLGGEDGADYLIIKKAIDLINTANFDHVYVCSGDHSMASYVNYLQDMGIKVTIVSLRRCISSEMRATGAEILWLEDDYSLAA